MQHSPITAAPLLGNLRTRELLALLSATMDELGNRSALGENDEIIAAYDKAQETTSDFVTAARDWLDERGETGWPKSGGTWAEWNA